MLTQEQAEAVSAAKKCSEEQPQPSPEVAAVEERPKHPLQQRAEHDPDYYWISLDKEGGTKSQDSQSLKNKNSAKAVEEGVLDHFYMEIRLF